MGLVVLFLGKPNLSSLRAVPAGIPVIESRPEDALDVAGGIDAKHLLVIDSYAYAGAQTFAAARSLQADGGILGGCATEADGTKRFGAVFAAVQFGPYDVEPFPLIDPRGTNGAAQPQRESIDVIAAGTFLIDREVFCELGGFDAALGSPWNVYDLCMRVRQSGKPVRWDPRLAFGVEVGIVPASDAVDRRDFVSRWGKRLSTRVDVDTLARGLIRRTRRTALGQRDVATLPIPPTDAILYGNGPATPKHIRDIVKAQRVSVDDARGEESRCLQVLRDLLQSRSDRYVALLNAAAPPAEGWLERALIQIESRPLLRGVREGYNAVLALPRIPLDANPSPQAASISEAVDALLSPRAPAGKRLSVILVAHSRAAVHRTSFEAIYGGELEIDYHAVGTPERPESFGLLKTYPTLDVIVDESRGLAGGINTAFAHCQGDIVIVIGDDFYPPAGWLDVVREAFALRPDMGILGFSATLVNGPQFADVAYADIKEFKALAARRRATLIREARLTDQLTALAFAVDARALAAVGGIDKKLGAGRFGIEDLTLRVRRAGYAAYVADDLLIHHFDREMSSAFLGDPDDESRYGQYFAQKWKGRTDFNKLRDFVTLA